MLLSLEHELPVVRTSTTDAGTAPEPGAFATLWDDLSRQGWERDATHMISRPFAHPDPSSCAPRQTMTTDTGPTLEVAPSPALSIASIESQLTDIRCAASASLAKQGLLLIGSGVHPRVAATEEEYYRLRTPRTAYDYAIRERGWHHWSILHIAAMQEVLDVPFDRALQVFSVMNRLTGVMLFLFRNDPAYGARREDAPIYSVRPGAWRAHIPPRTRFASDHRKVGMLAAEVTTWREYFDMLWGGPMFLLGTKSGETVYIPEHPTFAQFLMHAPPGGWDARRVAGGSAQRVSPDMSFVQQTDWTHMGFARVRLFWESGTDIAHLINAYDDTSFEDFLRSHLRKVLIENRSSATPPPGFEMCSLAFVTGIIENIDAAAALTREKPYRFWQHVARAAETQVLDSSVDGVYIPELLAAFVAASAEGLRRRGMGEESYLAPLRETVLGPRRSHAERNLQLWNEGGVDALVSHLSYR